MTDDQYLLASVYADAAASPAERAQAEADPEVMAEVARIRELQAALADVAPAPATVRTAAISAAMAEFGNAAPAPLPAVSSQRAFPWSRTLGLAAAAVAVLAIGAVAVTGARRGGDDDMADSAAATVTDAPLLRMEDAENRPEAAAEAPAATAAGAGAAELDQATLSAEDGEVGAVPAAPTPGEPHATGLPASTFGDGTGAPTASIPPPSDAALYAATTLIGGPDELAAAGRALRDAYWSGVVSPDEPDTDCTPEAAVAAPETDAADDQLTSLDDVALLDTRDYLTTDGTIVAVFVAVDLESAQTYAIDAVRCVLVGVGTAP